VGSKLSDLSQCPPRFGRQDTQLRQCPHASDGPSS